MMEDAGKDEEETNRQKKGQRLISFTGGTALLALVVSFAVFAFNSHKKKSKKRELPGFNVRLHISASEILKLAEQIIAKSNKVHDSVASVPLDKVSYENVVLPLAELEAYLFPLIQSCCLPKLVASGDKERQASAEAERKIDAHALSCRKREDVYCAVKAYAEKGESMVPAAKSYVEYLVKDFERNGLYLDVTRRKKVEQLHAQIEELSLQYVQNLNSDGTSLLFDEAELSGLPKEFLKSLDTTENGMYKIFLRSSHVALVLDFCKVGATRRSVAIAYGNRCGEANLSVLRGLVQARHKLALLLGYRHYADYAVGQRMAGASSKVFEFLENLCSSLTDLAARDLAVLKDLKRKEEGQAAFGVEDLLYYIKRAEAQHFSLDFIHIKSFFPLDAVVLGILKISQELFGLRFEEIMDAEVWHCDVQVFSVHDFSSGELLGHVFLDMYKREGKFGHTCVVPLQTGACSFNGVRQIPVALLIAQFQKDGVQPVLLGFSDMVNLFHEFGHVVQHICNRASFARFSGLHFDPDFVEVPSQLLENWCYESRTLKLISGQNEDLNKFVSDGARKSLKRWRFSFSSLKSLQEVLYSLVDQIIHTTENVDFHELFKQLHPKVMLGLPMLEGSNPASCFAYAAVGSDATCYSRLWSEVLAADMYATGFPDGELNQHAGRQFRNKVLVPGGAKDPNEVLRDFLGREPSIRAFIDNVTGGSTR